MRGLLFPILLFFTIAVSATEPTKPNSPPLNFGLTEFTKTLWSDNSDEFVAFANDEFIKHFEVLSKRQLKYKKEHQFVEYAFYYIHKKLLKNYEQYASISETISVGKYDCVTASAVYSLFLTELNIPFSVIETNYHMYMLVYPGTKNELLLETTDPLNGFIANKKKIAFLKQKYLQENNTQTANQASFNWNINRVLSGDELLGTLLYNQSVKQFNLGNTKEAKILAQKALHHDKSVRNNSYVKFLEQNQIASN